METGAVRPQRRNWSCTGTTQALYCIGTGLVPAGRRKKTKDHLAPWVSLGS